MTQAQLSFPDKKYCYDLSLSRLPNEKWKNFPGFSRYQVSSLGRIKSKESVKLVRGGFFARHKPKIRKQQLNRTGYLICSMRDDSNIVRNMQVHQAVARTFIKNPENKKCINHKNFIKTDNTVSNLEWCTKKENSHHAKELLLRGQESPLSKLNNKQVLEIFKSALPLSEISSKYSVDKRTINRIKNKRIWKHLLDNKGLPGKNKMPYKIDLKAANNIRRLHSGGYYSHRELAEKYNIGKTQVGYIINNKRWKT